MSREEVHKRSNPQGKSDIVNGLEELIGLFCGVGKGGYWVQRKQPGVGSEGTRHIQEAASSLVSWR